jgi:hypothetical protein
MDVNDCLTLIRFFLMILACFTFLAVYTRLRFKGFLTLAAGTVFSAAALTLIKLGMIASNDLIYELLLLCVVAMWIISAYLIYHALSEYHTEST